MPDDEPPNEPGHVSASRTDAHPPMPRDKRGWQVAPAPDGRGMPEQTPQRPAGTPHAAASCGSCWS